VKEQEISKKSVEKNFPKLFWMNIFSSMLTLTPVITLFYLLRGLSYSDLFLLSMVFGIGSFLFEVPTGMLADKIGRKKSILLAFFLLQIHNVAYLFAFGFLQMSLAFLVFVISFTLLSGTVEALIYDSLKFCGREKDMKKEYGKFLSAGKFPSIFMPFVAAIIAKNLLNWQFNTLIFISIVAMVVAIWFAFRLKEPERHFERENKSKHLLKDSVQLFKTNKNFRRIFFNAALIAVPFQLFWRIWQPYLTNLAVPVIILGIIVATHNAITFFLQRNIHKIEEKFGMQKVMLALTILPFIGYILLIFFPNLITALVGIYLVFVFSVSRGPLESDYLNTHIKSENRATALSFLNMLNGIFSVVLMGVTAYLTIYYQFMGLYIAGGLVLIGLLFFRLKDIHVKRHAVGDVVPSQPANR